jgi:hypothetical protein
LSFGTNNTLGLTLDGSNNVGVGTTAPVSLLSVGSGSKFQVNSTGNIVKLNDVTTTFPAAHGTTNQCLSDSDGAGTLAWETVVLPARTISTTAPLTGGGTLAADRTFTIPVATTSANGYLSSTDWTTFNTGAAPGTTTVSGTAKRPQGELFYTAGSAVGTLPNRIVHYATATVATGTSVITYTGSTTNGDQFALGEAGIYSASMVALNPGGNSSCGISNNASSGNTNVMIDTITAATRLVYGSGPGAATCSVVFHAAANDIIRAHLNDSVSVNSGAGSFRIIQLSKD